MVSMENPLSLLILMVDCFELSNCQLTVPYQATASWLSLSQYVTAFWQGPTLGPTVKETANLSSLTKQSVG